MSWYWNGHQCIPRGREAIRGLLEIKKYLFPNPKSSLSSHHVEQDQLSHWCRSYTYAGFLSGLGIEIGFSSNLLCYPCPLPGLNCFLFAWLCPTSLLPFHTLKCHPATPQGTHCRWLLEVLWHGVPVAPHTGLLVPQFFWTVQHALQQLSPR